MELDTQLDALGLYDIYDVYHVPFWQTVWFYYSVLAVCVFLFLSLVSFTAFIFIRRRRKKSISSWEKALHELAILEQQKIMQPVTCDQFYECVTRITRVYLSERFNIDVLSNTDDEMCAYIQKSDDSSLKSLDTVFNAGIMAKFARSSFTLQQIEKDYTKVKQFVIQTIPKEQNNDVAKVDIR